MGRVATSTGQFTALKIPHELTEEEPEKEAGAEGS